MAWVIGNGSFQGWSLPWMYGKCCTLLWCVRWKKFIHCDTNALSFATCSCGGKSANACIAAHTGIATPQSSQCPCREPRPLASISPLAAARINIQPRLVRDAATPSVNQSRGLMYACLGWATHSGLAPSICKTNNCKKRCTMMLCPTGSFTTRRRNSSYRMAKSMSASLSRLTERSCVSKMAKFLLSAMLGVQKMSGAPQKIV